ncbi:MAG: hypothetical protein NUV65_06110 [Candidatus Roizmanbacteria bacterium]|nr:hypothetical protein [Candidatus Roizmanbacteria bacterium]
MPNIQYPTRLPASTRGEPARQVNAKAPMSKVGNKNLSLIFCHSFVIWILSFVVTLFLPFYFPVMAQQISLSVNPPQVQIITKPDKSLTQGFTFVNDGDEGIFSIRVVSFEPTINGGRIMKDKAEGPIRFSLANPTIHMDEPFALSSKEQIQALLSVRVTPGAPEGDYYYSIMLISQAPVSQRTSARGVGVITANILITVTHDGFLDNQIKVAQFQVVPDYQINLFGTTYTILTQSQTIPVIFSVANIGKNLFSPTVKVTLQGPFGLERNVEMIPVFLLAHTQRQLFAENVNCQNCTNNPSVVLRGSGWGKYVAIAEINIEGSDKKLYAQTQFWVLPVSLIMYVAIAIGTGMVILLILKFTKRH